MLICFFMEKWCCERKFYEFQKKNRKKKLVILKLIIYRKSFKNYFNIMAISIVLDIK